MQPWIIAIIVIAPIICLSFALSALTFWAAFGKRYDKNPLLKYFTADDFNLTCGGFSLGELCGCIYENKSAEQRKEVVIFAPGMGPGQCAYTTEIAYFCNLGYTVVSTDSLGCGLSSGKNIRGMYEGAKTVIKTIDFVKKQYAGQKVYLVGHSWGGYSVLCAADERKVDGVVAIGAPASPSKTLQNGAAQFIGRPLAVYLRPFWYVINFFKFGAKGNKNAAKCASKSSAPVLIVHGDKDLTVAKNNSAYIKAAGNNVQKLLAEGKAHNPYNTQNAEKLLAELSRSLRRAGKMSEDERNNYFQSFDFTAATEEDSAVMSAISDFFQRIS